MQAYMDNLAKLGERREKEFDAERRRRKRSERTRKPEETRTDAGLHGQPSETGGGNGSTTQSRSVTKYSVRVKIWSGRTKYASIFGPPPPQTVLLVAHAFRSVKARVTASETAREMCADENEDLVEKACLYLFDGRYPEGSTSNDKRVIRRKAATLTLRDGEVFYKKPKKNSTGQKVNIYVARSVWHPCIDGFDQTGGI